MKNVQLEQKIDSIEQEVNSQLEIALKQLQTEKNNAVEALRESNKSSK